MRLLLSTLSLTALAGCADVPSTAPPSARSATLAVGAIDNVPLRDALDRIVPTLGSSAAATALGAALTNALEHRSDASLAAIEGALERLTNTQPETAVEADVIRLAVAAQP